jgi:hypothetical protein
MASKVAVRLKNVLSYHHLKGDAERHDGDVVDVIEGRAVALIQQGFAEPAERDKAKR